MTNKVYTIYNKLSQRYGEVVCFASDNMALRRICTSPLYKAALDEIEVCRVGSIDIETGILIAEPPIRIAIPDEFFVKQPAEQQLAEQQPKQ